MPASQETIASLSSAIVRELPANRIGEFLTKFQGSAVADSCGAGCGSGCCGAACSASVDGPRRDRRIWSHRVHCCGSQ